MSEIDALTTLGLLDDRLRRLEYLVTGAANPYSTASNVITPVHANETVSACLEQLENDLQKLRRKNGLVEEVLRLRQSSSH